jgi:hypothetical protein
VGPNCDGSECAHKDDIGVSYFSITGRQATSTSMYQNVRTARMRARQFFSRRSTRARAPSARNKAPRSLRPSRPRQTPGPIAWLSRIARSGWKARSGRAPSAFQPMTVPAHRRERARFRDRASTAEAIAAMKASDVAGMHAEVSVQFSRYSVLLFADRPISRSCLASHALPAWFGRMSKNLP